MSNNLVTESLTPRRPGTRRLRGTLALSLYLSQSCGHGLGSAGGGGVWVEYWLCKDELQGLPRLSFLICNTGVMPRACGGVAVGLMS